MHGFVCGYALRIYRVNINRRVLFNAPVQTMATAASQPLVAEAKKEEPKKVEAKKEAKKEKAKKEKAKAAKKVLHQRTLP